MPSGKLHDVSSWRAVIKLIVGGDDIEYIAGAVLKRDTTVLN
jgi:hypothetical protein